MRSGVQAVPGDGEELTEAAIQQMSPGERRKREVTPAFRLSNFHQEIRMVRSNGEAAAECLQRLAAPAGKLQDQAQVEVVLRLVGLELNGPLAEPAPLLRPPGDPRQGGRVVGQVLRMHQHLAVKCEDSESPLKAPESFRVLPPQCLLSSQAEKIQAFRVNHLIPHSGTAAASFFPSGGNISPLLAIATVGLLSRSSSP